MLIIIYARISETYGSMEYYTPSDNVLACKRVFLNSSLNNDERGICMTASF